MCLQKVSSSAYVYAPGSTDQKQNWGYTYSGHLELLVILDFHHTLLLLGCPLMIFTLCYSCHFLKVNLRDHGEHLAPRICQAPIAEWSTNS